MKLSHALGVIAEVGAWDFRIILLYSRLRYGTLVIGTNSHRDCWSHEELELAESCASDVVQY
jgi:hypothetical protein